MNKLAQSSIDFYPNNGLRGIGNYGLDNATGDAAPTLFTTLLSTIIGVITIVAFIWFVFILITGALGIMGAGADKGALEGAKKKLTTGLIGLLVIVSGMFIAQIIGTFLGIDNFLSPTDLINQITQ